MTDLAAHKNSTAWQILTAAAERVPERNMFAAAELLARLKPGLAHFKLPREARLGNGTIDRVMLQQRAKAEEKQA